MLSVFNFRKQTSIAIEQLENVALQAGQNKARNQNSVPMQRCLSPAPLNSTARNIPLQYTNKSPKNFSSSR